MDSKNLLEQFTGKLLFLRATYRGAWLTAVGTPGYLEEEPRLRAKFEVIDDIALILLELQNA
jgi:hypothetical protein